jgi:NAD+ kinase
MKKFYIITNFQKDPDFTVTKQILQYFREHGCVCQVKETDNRIDKGPYHYTDADLIPQDVQCILVLGGDGTLLQAARDVVHRQIPLFGINMGTLGYLAEVNKQSIYPALDQLLRDDYEIEERMMLKGSVYHHDRMIGEDVALNDIVIGRTGPQRVIRFENYVNDEYLNSYHADGIIVSTPTGSTGYSLSAGGPIISPAARMITLTPLAPHTLNSRSIILPAEDVVKVEIGPGRRQMEEKGLANFDGDTTISMATGDYIVIRQSEIRTKIVKLKRQSFVEVLRQKMRNN